jgi:hypothetical protein
MRLDEPEAIESGLERCYQRASTDDKGARGRRETTRRQSQKKVAESAIHDTGETLER